MAAIIIRLPILTGARRGEIEGLKWSEVDFNFGMLRRETSKAGAKIIPMGWAALQILDDQRRRPLRRRFVDTASREIDRR